jgi:PKD repeat protein
MRRWLWLLLLPACHGSTGSPAPTALIAAPDHGTVGEALSFDGSGSSAATRYSWDFGDGSRGGGDKLAHVFSAPGSYSVTLTVAGNGKTATDSVTVEIAGVTPGPQTPVVGVVRDPSGAPLAGGGVREGSTTATSDADGLIKLTLTADPHLLQLSKDGYSSQFQPLELTHALSGYFEATMTAREATQPLDADQGGTLKGKDGASVTLPAGALVDGAGTPVTGMVEVALTPVDISSTSTREAFPGRFEGLTPDAARGPIMSLGTVEYALLRGGERLQLAPGKTATLDIPLYATRNADGSPLAMGGTIPLWSLDESSGAWIQEGEGTVTQSPDTPSQLALHGDVSQCSWRKRDSPMPNPTNIGIR